MAGKVILVAVLLWFGWPTPYRYFVATVKGDDTRGSAQVMVRVNRFTGTSEASTPDGWKSYFPSLFAAEATVP